MRNLSDYNEGASSFHNDFREAILSDGFLKSLHWFQEVNVRDLIPNYRFYNHHFDWYCRETKHVFELHGRQHYELVKFTSRISMDEAVKSFQAGKKRDDEKRAAAEIAGFNYVVVPYTEQKKINAKYIRNFLENI